MTTGFGLARADARVFSLFGPEGLLCAAAIVLALALSSPLAATAAAATAPAASSGGASSVSYGTATLNGAVNPRGSDASYYFQYGPTKAYGLQTGILDAGSGSKGVHVAVAISGLTPLTQYHYRLVAVGSGGFGYGADKSFHTTKVPLSLGIFASPNPVLYGGNVTIQGSLSGTDNANRAVVLQVSPFPYTAGFVSVGNPELTNSSGGFSFPYLGLIQGAAFRVVTTTNPPVISTIVFESVNLRVSAKAGRVGPRGRALFYGTVSPAMDKAEIAVMHFTGGKRVFVAGTRLRHRNSSSSRFSLLAKAKRGGVYQILVHIPGGPLSSTYSPPILVR
ncbi:MAG TPA: fibronectin type III domain-containing protein [Solirubrobacteraceae bacterium]|nr:fibronectin type III domain-containing protein [Solirubrobacteraceae bacterium]